MGTTVSSLQILGATEDAVKVAMPKAIVGKWSERYVTACLYGFAFGALERKAGWLSKKLDCTVFSVSLFDGDMLSLALYTCGKRTARHVVNPETGEVVLGNVAAFCTGLKVRETLAPDLKRLFSTSNQEEKLHILSILLGAPLFARWDEPFEIPSSQIADEAPLQTWVAEHPLPPKIKNQARVELLQKIAERMPSYADGNALILRPLAYADEHDAFPIGTVTGHYCAGGEWAHWNWEGRLVLTPLDEDGLCNLGYAEANGRLLTFTQTYEENFHECYTPKYSTLVADSAGLLPLPLSLTPDDEPAVASSLHLLPNGGFLALFQQQFDMAIITKEAVLCCYTADGTRLWMRQGQAELLALIGNRMYLKAFGSDGIDLHSLDLNGQMLASIPSYGTQLMASGNYLYQLEAQGYRKDDTLHRFTSDLEDAGCLQVPYMSDMAISSDGSSLLCAGYSSGLAVIDLDEFKMRRAVHSRDNVCAAMADGKNRFWVGNNGYIECYSPDLELLSRHRLAGEIMDSSLNPAGELCLATYQRKNYLTRVYRLY